MRVAPPRSGRFPNGRGTGCRLARPTPARAVNFATVVWIVLVIAVAAVTYLKAFDNRFVWDDEPFIVRNDSLLGPGSLTRVFTAGDAFGTGRDNPYYRPVTTLSFAIDLRLFGDSPVGYHATNILLHLVVSVLVFLVALRLTGLRLAAGVAALLFAVHPASAEPVAYVSARADLLCAAFMLAAVLLHLRGRAAGCTRELGFAAVAFALALLAKIVALALLPLLALREILFVPPRERRFGTLVPYAALAGAFFLARGLVLERTTWDSGVAFTSRLATAGPLLLGYLKNTLWPFDLKVFYDVPRRVSWGDPAVLGAWAILLVSAGLWLILLRRRAVVALGIAWYFVALFPVSGVVALLQPALMADRYLYLPLVGAALAAAGAIASATEALAQLSPARTRAVVAIGCAAVIACCSTFAASAACRVPAWRDQASLWEEARRGAPASPYVLNALGITYWQAERLDEAQGVLARAAALAPEFTDPLLNLGIVAFFKGDLDTSASFTEQVLRLDPGDSAALRQRGIISELRGFHDRAVASLEASVAVNPFDWRSRRYLSELVAHGRDCSEALPPPGVPPP